MASIGELKKRAKSCLKQYYWMAFLVSLVAFILGGGGSSLLNLGRRGYSDDYSSPPYGGVSSGEFLILMSILITILLVVLIISAVLQIFVSNVVRVGLSSYFLESRKTQTSAGFPRLFFGFGGGNYMKIVKVMFMQSLIIFAWTLLLIIPGIIKGYQYAMVPYILAENPDTDYRSALKFSRDMMRGHKLELFILELSFIGWYLLGLLACGVGMLFVMPYQYATTAEYYVELKQNVTSKFY